MMGITSNRLNHILAVARKMRDIVKRNPDKFEFTPEEAYILGYMHDIGYDFADNQLDHARIGGEILKQQGYKYWQEVYWHNTIQDEYKSSKLSLLNYVDMTIGPNGEDFTLQERVDEIAIRYGMDSVQYKVSIELVKELMTYDWN